MNEAPWIQACIALFANPNAHELDLAACRGLLEASPSVMSLEGVLLTSVGLVCLTYLLSHWRQMTVKG